MLRTPAVLFLGILACSDSPVGAPPPSEPKSPLVLPVPPAPQLGTEYALVRVNYGPLPSKSPIGAGYWDDDGAIIELESATLALHADGTVLETWNHQSVTNGERATQTCKGRYTIISNAVLQIGTGDGATFMTLSATGLVWEIPGFILEYKLVK